jgi:hypothetical protein
MTTRPGYVWDGGNDEWVEIGQAAVLAPVKYQATAPSSPATGDIWIDSDDEAPGITSSLNYRWRRIATGGETSLSGNDSSGLPLAYNPGYEQVYLNGVLQYRGSDYVATTGNTITGLTALVANDTIEVLSFVTAPIGDAYGQAAADAKFNPIGIGYSNFTSFATTGSNSSTSIADFNGGGATTVVKRSSSTKLLVEITIQYSPQYANTSDHVMYVQINGTDYQLTVFASGAQYNMTQRIGMANISGIPAGTYTAKVRYKVTGLQDLYTLAGYQNYIKVTEVA